MTDRPSAFGTNGVAFARLTQQETGLPILLRASRVVAIARTEDGGSRVFLGGSLSCLVTEDEAEVARALQAPAEPID